MSNSVQENENFKFAYSPFEFTDQTNNFLQLANEYYITNPLQDELPAQGLDLLFEIESEDYLSLFDIKEKITNKFLSNYLDTIFKEAEVNEISSLKHLCVWIQGNHEKLNYSCSKLDVHTHLDGDLNANSIINTHTVIIPLFIENTVTESFWLRWIGDVEHTITAKLKILNSIGMGTVSKEIRVPALSEWWKKLEEISTNEMCVKFPKKGEKLTLDFNSRNYLHGIKNIGKNLYLIILFDRCKLKI